MRGTAGCPCGLDSSNNSTTQQMHRPVSSPHAPSIKHWTCWQHPHPTPVELLSTCPAPLCVRTAWWWRPSSSTRTSVRQHLSTRRLSRWVCFVFWGGGGVGCHEQLAHLYTEQPAACRVLCVKLLAGTQRVQGATTSSPTVCSLTHCMPAHSYQRRACNLPAPCHTMPCNMQHASPRRPTPFHTTPHHTTHHAMPCAACG